MKTENNDDLESNNSDVRPSEYVKDLLKEKLVLDPELHQNAMRLIDDEVGKAQQTSRPLKPEPRYVDIYKEKPIKVTTKVLVPVKEHPRFNFVGKLLGPKGNSLKRLQEETLTKMAILGRGSMRDKTKEEELRNSLDPKYAHLADDLHVEIQALGPPAEAYARIAYALAEIRKYLVPDGNDEIRQEQLREIQQFGGIPRGGPPGGGRGGPPMGPPRGGGAPRGGHGRGLSPQVRAPVMPPRAPMAPPPGPAPPRQGGVMPGKSKVLSILDRARAAMEDSYNQAGYDESGYFESSPSMGYTQSYNGAGYFDGGGGYGGSGAGDASGSWKAYGPPSGADGNQGSGGKMQGNVGPGRYNNARPSPYGRPK